eukprot:TRINITY_DN7550_c0_g1_i1.p2 TRINITY_DN7550_c0_g1~~TRINITY_DN7550_c0_g1_i1.p2  ORF type:complete len:502 (+),score=221.05 TRINITY_DN7550_c0_g1_i1:72-1577(+)
MVRSATAAAALLLAGSAAGAAVSRVGARGRFFTDAEGRVRFFHGFNDVQEAKGSGSSPGGAAYTPKMLMKESNLDALQKMGFNVFRLPMMWAAAMPAAGTFDEAYLGTMKGVVDDLAKRGMYGFLDMHQDVLSSKLGSYDGAPLWLVNRTEQRHAYPWPLKAPLKNWGLGYVTEAVGQSFQEIYDNKHGGLDAWASFWKKVATTFRGNEGVLGYELINEPWAGDIWHNPLLLLPGMAGKHNLAPAYEKVASAIREVDDETIIMFEPVTWGYLFPGSGIVGSGFKTVPGGEKYANRSCLSWHYYCWVLNADYANSSSPYPAMTKGACDHLQGPLMFSSVAKDAASLNTATLLSEFGALTPHASHPDSKGTEELEWVLDEADKHLQSWTYWDMVALRDSTGGLNNDTVFTFVRSYASAVAGVPESMSFDSKTAAFSLRYTPDAAVKAPTEIMLPPLRYPSGYTVTLSEGLSSAPCVDGASWKLCVTAAASAAGKPASVDVARK